MHVRTAWQIYHHQQKMKVRVAGQVAWMRCGGTVSRNPAQAHAVPEVWAPGGPSVHSGPLQLTRPDCLKGEQMSEWGLALVGGEVGGLGRPARGPVSRALHMPLS